MAFPGEKLESPLQLSQLFTNKIPGNYLGIASLAGAEPSRQVIPIYFPGIFLSDRCFPGVFLSDS